MYTTNYKTNRNFTIKTFTERLRLKEKIEVDEQVHKVKVMLAWKHLEDRLIEAEKKVLNKMYG